MNLLIILAIIFVFAIYGLICFYIGYNGWAWLKTTTISKYKKTYIGIILFLSLSLFARQLLPIDFFEIISAFWMGIAVFSLFLLPIANLVVFFFKKKGIGVFKVGFVVLSLYVLLFAYGSYNAWSPVIVDYDIEIDKKSDEKDLKILLVSDFHLGSIVGETHLERFIKIVDKEQPDIVLIPGDIINDHIRPFLKKDMGKTLEKISAPLGVYATLGNHDYYGNDMAVVLKEMDRIGIRVLMDEYISINDSFYLAGRKDHTDESRAKITEFMKKMDPAKPVIMMDHQPKDLDEAKMNGVDLLLSGHTHGGQIAPVTFFTDLIFENDHGYLRKGNFHSIVTSGFGNWGPPLRIGTRAEVIVINVHFAG